MTHSNRRLFIAGASGETGKVVVSRAQARGLDFVAHYRPKRGAPTGVANAAVFELSDASALADAMRGCTTVLQLIGTMRKRFSAGDTYEASDIGTTRELVAAAKKTGVDHVVLLSSLGAGTALGAYLKAKAEAERLVRESGLGWTIFRPGALWGGERKLPAADLMESVTKSLHLQRLRPVRLEDLASAVLSSAMERRPLDTILERKPFWDWVAHANAR